MTDLISPDRVLTSFGTFKPVGHLILGLPANASLPALEAALIAADWPGESLLHFAPGRSVAEFEAMVGDAGAMAGFGYEITLLHRYLALSREGYRWLLVKVDDGAHAVAAADLARVHGAGLAVYYRTLVTEELL